VADPSNNHRDDTLDEPKLWPISVEGKWGFIDAAGNIKIPIQFARAKPFREGLALVSVFGTSNDDLQKNRSYDGFIDESGQFVIPAEFPAFMKREDYSGYGYSSFEDGVAVVDDASGTFSARGLIDRQGNLIAPMIEQSLDYFGEGLCSFERPKKRGYMDYQGKVVIQPKGFLYGSEFSDGRAVITVRKKKDDQEFIIDRQGNVIVGPDKYTFLGRIHGGLASVMKDGAVGLIDRDGQVVVPLGEYDRIMEPDRGSTYLAEKQGVSYALRANAEPVQLPDFGAEPIRFCDELILLRTSDRKHGFAKTDGTIVVEPVFTDLSSGFHGELCKFHRALEQGYVNRSGKVVWSTTNWELPLKYSIREPLESYLPNFGLEALPLSYNWDCKNAIVFVCDGNVQKLREFFLNKQSDAVRVKDWTNFESEPGKVEMWLYFEGVTKLEVYAMHGDDESNDPEETNNFVEFYSCKNMDGLRTKYPGKTIGIIIEN
jgi:hypothetical protein